MIRNLSRMYKRNELAAKLESLGIRKKFIRLPIKHGSNLNVGYAFINCEEEAVNRADIPCSSTADESEGGCKQPEAKFIDTPSVLQTASDASDEDPDTTLDGRRSYACSDGEPTPSASDAYYADLGTALESPRHSAFTDDASWPTPVASPHSSAFSDGAIWPTPSASD